MIGKNSRRQVAHISVLGTTQLHLRNPYIIAWWSVAFPGTGHLLLSKYLRGFLLFILEITVNLKAHINTAIFYSFTGRFELAKGILDKRWLILYCSLYIFAVWDSYRTTVDINNNYILAAREDSQISSFKLGCLEFNYLDKRSPIVSAIWSLLMPGTGQLYIHRIVMAAFLITWWIAIIYLSNILPAIHYTFTGDFEKVKPAIDPHWALNISSVYLYSMYDAYTNTVENNKLFDWEQSKFVQREYQSNNFNMPSKKRCFRGDIMHIIATFEHSIYLEKAITEIEMRGVPKEDILAVPMDKRDEKRKVFDSLHESDGLSLIDLGAILGTIFMLMGTIYGFLLKWGPIIWGLIGLVAGFISGLIIKLVITKKYTNRPEGKKSTEVVLIIKCGEDKSDMVKNVFWSNHALGISKIKFE
ncbi:hypothetical protein [Ruminiclostridium papyrosolvens]|uniref:Membrane protein n=1 Tax=Ruminiclostridium papyrosolvens C7 TaxID=1330534 RepID=U4R583_9FIRM|nr:hypothetical protein [Ruminiclostridium papyrosolvens]EPR13569.1 membrane protein [Ruminiclostridium papyrosolvens C7]